MKKSLLKSIVSVFIVLMALSNISMAQLPVISAFTPTSAKSGATIIISGSNFNNVSSVAFGGVSAATYTVLSSTAMIATVGNGASGSISVTNASGIGSLIGFTFIASAPIITSFSPSSGNIGTTLTILGNNFSTTPTNNIVYFGAVKATVTASTVSSLTVTVPTGATYQPISVTTNNLTAFSSNPFIVTFSGGGNSFSTNTFATKVDFSVGSGSGITCVGDIDGDGKPDLIALNGGSNTFSILKNISQSNPSFASKLDFATSSSPTGGCVVDLDGDGKLDIAMTFYNANKLGVFRNISSVGSISLSSESDFSAVSSPSWVAAGDFDGDGKPDLVVGNAGSRTISVFLNTSTPGNVSFVPKVDYNVGNGNNGNYVVSVGDIDGDGKTDIISSNYSDATLSVTRNTSTVGTLSFAPVVTFSVGGGTHSVAVGDLDGDGKLDLVSANSAGASISVLKNISSIGNVAFTSRVDLTTGSGSTPIAISLADLDGDGKPDISVANISPSNYISVFRNTSIVGSLSFDATKNYATSANPYGVATADLDGDGKSEIIAAAAGANTVSILRNQIGEPVISSFTPLSAVAGTSVIISGNNFNNITGVSFGGVPATSFTVVSSSAIVASVGNGASGNVSVTTSSSTSSLGGFTFLVPVPTITTFSPASGAIGTTVIITGTNFSTIPSNNIVWFGSVRAAVSAATATSLTVTVPAGATYLPITVTVNNLIAASSKPFMVTFAGGGTVFNGSSFSAKIDSAVGSAPESVTVSDIDGDGKSDIIVTNQNGNTISILRNTSIGVKNISFATKVDISTSTFPLGGCATDLDGDGKPDLVIVSHNGNKVGVFRNTSTVGNISMASEIDYATGSSPYSVAVGDLDGDGKPDLAVCNSSSHTISVYLNTSTVGNLSFTNKIDYTVSGYVVGVAIGDMDGDGKLDIIATNNSPYTVSVLRNTSSGNGNISFASYKDFATESGSYCTVIGDLDGDGKLDLVVTNESAGTLSVLKNNSTVGNVSFTTKVDYAAQSGGLPSYLCLTDMEGDGKLDIATVSGFATTFSSVSLFRNNSNIGAISFETPVNYTSSAGAFNIYTGDLDGDGKPDIISASSSVNSVSIFRNQIGEPVITSFTPSSAAAGTSVIISGNNFNNVIGVSFGGVPATSITVVSSTAIIATVGKGASGNIIVTTASGSASFSGFIFNASVPTITSFSPTTATIGYADTIKGSGFTTATAVTFGGTAAASFSIVNDSIIIAILGSGTSGNVSVTNTGGTVSLAGFSYCTGINVAFSISASTVDIAPNSSVTFTSSATNAGSAPVYQWYKNGMAISGATANSYTSNTLVNNDVVYAILKSNATCTINGTVTSNQALIFVNNGIINAFAGNGTTGYLGDGGAASAAGFSFKSSSTNLNGLAFDTAGNLYIVDASDNVVRKVNKSGIISTFAGNGNAVYGGDGGTATSASLNSPSGVAVDKAGNVYIADYSNYRIRKVDVNGIITTVAGVGTSTYSGDGGLATSAGLKGPTSVALDSLGNLYICDYKNYRIRKVNTSGIISTVAGNGSSCCMTSSGDGGLATAANLGNPIGIAVDRSGNLFISQNTTNNSIRKVNTNGIISTIVGTTSSMGYNTDHITATSAWLNSPAGLVVDSIGNLYFCDKGNYRIRKVGINDTIQTIAGTGSMGNSGDGGYAVSAQLSNPSGLAIDAVGNLYFSDVSNHRIRKINLVQQQSQSPIISSFAPSSAGAGATVTIKGTAFIGASAVSFGGTAAASFNVVNDTLMTAVVGGGASGNVSITTNVGTASLTGFSYCEPTTSTTNASVCSGSSYTFNGSTYTNAGTYTVHLTNSIGCDSIATLNLSVKTNATSITNASICQGYNYNFNGNIYTVAGTYVVHLNNSLGCDSAATLNLSIKSNSTSTTNASICAGSSYTFNGSTYTKAGSYTAHLINEVGCDSAATLILSVKSNSISTTNASICVGGSYTFNGSTYTKAGSYTAHLINVVGCDSAATLILIIKSNSISTTNASICTGGSYTFNGNIYTQAGSYTTHLTNALGCDSAATLVLTVKSASTSTTNANINQGNSYTFNGNNYTLAGTYTAHLINSVGCDSAATLVLTVTSSYIINGNVKNPLGTIIPSVTISMNGTQTVTTDASGNYTFSAVANSKNSIIPSKNNDKTIANGVNGTDISLIQSHILKKVVLNSPYKLIAADVNSDGAVNGTDIALIKSLILKHITKFTGNKLWSFVDSSFIFTTPTKPFPYYDSISIANITSNQGGKNFIGVKLGDVNYDWNAAVLGIDNKATQIEMFHDNISVNSAITEVRVPIKVKNFRNIMGMQYTLNFNSEVLELKAVDNNRLSADYNLDYTSEGKIPFLWVDAASEARTLPDSSVLFELVFNKKRNLLNEVINLTSDITAINAFDGNYNTVEIRKVGGEISENSIVTNTMTVFPNPAKETIVIKGDHIDKIQVIDNFGKIIKLLSLHDATNPAIQVGSLISGVYHLRVQTVDGKVSGINFIKE